ncbi:MAG: hypothetical protein AAF617_12500, partial [Bacteroidota bacterium]
FSLAFGAQYNSRENGRKKKRSKKITTFFLYEIFEAELFLSVLLLLYKKKKKFSRRLFPFFYFRNRS